MRRYENPVQARCLLEGIPPNTILADWHSILETKMAEWKLERAQVSRVCKQALILKKPITLDPLPQQSLTSSSLWLAWTHVLAWHSPADRLH